MSPECQCTEADLANVSLKDIYRPKYFSLVNSKFSDSGLKNLLFCPDHPLLSVGETAGVVGVETRFSVWVCLCLPSVSRVHEGENMK